MSSADAGAPQTAGSWRPAGNPWLIALVVTMAAFMEVLDTTIITVALPHIAGSMSASYDESTWVLTSYLVANGIVLLISGFFTRLLGRKRYFLICLAMFTVCSFLCGIATSLTQIIVFRLMQGFFGGGLQPNQQSIILDTFPPQKRAAAFGLASMATVIAPVMGPALGGIITDHASWRWIFFINIPFGIIAYLGVNALVEDPPWLKIAGKVKASMDYVGLGFIILGLGAFQIMLDRGQNADWFNSNFIRSLAVLSVVGIVGAIYWLLYAKKPIVDLRVMADRNFALGCAMISAMSIVLYTSSVLLPQLSEQQLGYTATLAGLILMPGALAIGTVIILITRVFMTRVHTRYLIGIGFFLISIAFLYTSRLTPDIDFFNLAKDRVLQTIGLGCLFVPISSMAYLTMPAKLNGDAAALYTMFRNVAGSIGISVSTALVSQRGQIHMAYLSGHLSSLSQPYNEVLSTMSRTLTTAGASLQTAQNGALYRLNRDLALQSQILAYSDVFTFCAVLALLVVPFTFLLAPGKVGPGGRGRK